MIPLWKIQQAQQLLEQDELSQRAIARLLGVSRGTINALATGKRGGHGRETPNETSPDPEPPARCPTCGRMMQMPCVWCRAMDYRRRQQTAQVGGKRAA